MDFQHFFKKVIPSPNFLLKRKNCTDSPEGKACFVGYIQNQNLGLYFWKDRKHPYKDAI